MAGRYSTISFALVSAHAVHCSKLSVVALNYLRDSNHLWGNPTVSHEPKKKQTSSWGTDAGNNMAEKFGCSGFSMRLVSGSETPAANGVQSRFPKMCWCQAVIKASSLCRNSVERIATCLKSISEWWAKPGPYKKASVLNSTSVAFWLTASTPTYPHWDAFCLWKALDNTNLLLLLLLYVLLKSSFML